MTAAHRWSRKSGSVLPTFLGAVVLNVGLLITLAALSRDRPMDREYDDSTPVHLIRMTPPEIPETTPREPPKPPEPKPTPRFEPELLRPVLGRTAAPGLAVVVDPGSFNLSADESFVFGMADVDQPPRPVFRSDPVYPERAQRLAIEGTVTVQFLVEADGSVREIEIVRARPEGTFEESVLRAVANWKFRPGTIDGHPVACWWTTDIKFELSGR